MGLYGNRHDYVIHVPLITISRVSLITSFQPLLDSTSRSSVLPHPPTELTGRTVKVEDCSRVVPWRVDNKYYSAQVQFVVCSHSGTEPEEREWEALLLLFNLAKVP